MISSKLMVGLVSVSLAASTSMAATKKSVKAAPKAKATAAKAATELPAATETTVEAPAPVSATAPAASTSTASISTATAEATPKRWGLLIDSWTESGIAATNRAQSDDTVEQNVNHGLLVRPSYKLNDTTSVALGFEMNHDIAARNKERTGTVTDPYAQIANSKLGMLGPVKVKGYLRAYAPLSLASQDPVAGRDLALRSQVNFVLPVSKAINVSYNLEPRYFFNKNKVVTTYDAEKNRFIFSSKENYRLLHFANLEASAGKWGFYQNAGMRSRWYHDTEAYMDNLIGRPGYKAGTKIGTDQKDELYLESGLSYAPIDQFTIVGGVYTDSHDLTKGPSQGIYRDDESLYFLELTVVL